MVLCFCNYKLQANQTLTLLISGGLTTVPPQVQWLNVQSEAPDCHLLVPTNIDGKEMEHKGAGVGDGG